MRVTSTDVARRAGVSRATVSYVLNDTPDQTISEQTRAAVQKAARDLGYRPNTSARSLRAGRSDLVLLPLAGPESLPVFGVAMEACAAALAEHRLTLVTDFTNYESTDDRLDAWLRIGPAAVIDLVLRRDDPTHGVLVGAGIRVVSAAGTSGPRSLRPIDVISDLAREVQVTYLLERGHRRIVLALPAAVHAAHFGRGRQRGMHRAVEKAGATMTVDEVELDRESMRAAVERWKRARPKVDAICAYNDELAVGLLSAMSDVGVRVPRDVAVIGVDDIPLASAVSPALTTVGHSLREIGESIAATIATLIESDELEGEFSLPEFVVVERESA